MIFQFYLQIMSKNSKSLFSTPEKYIRNKARSLPLGTCYINDGWKDSGMALIVVTRKHVNNNVTYAAFQVDLYCLGIKEAFYEFNVHQYTITELRKKHDEISDHEDPVNEADYSLVHNIIYGALEYGEDLGFKPPKSFNTAVFILEEDTEEIELIDIEFGLNGKPVVFFGKEKHPHNILSQLDKSVGKGNYKVYYGDEYDPDQNENFIDEEADDDLKDFVEGKEPDFIDKPLEEFDENDFMQIVEGKKQLDPENLFKFTIAASILGLHKKEKKEIDRIADQVEKWKISDGSPANEPDLFNTAQEWDVYNKLYDLYLASPENAIKSVKEAITQYPESFHFQNLLGMIYHALDQDDKLKQLAESLYQKFPDNVHAFSNLVNQLVILGEKDRVEKMLDHRFDIHKQFPGQKHFLPEELLSYLSGIINYFLLTGQLIPAAAYTFSLTMYEWSGHYKRTSDTLYILVGNALKEKYLDEMHFNN